VIPFGGNVITKDIKEGCTVMPQQAEKLKVKFGSALAEEVYDNRIITIPGVRGRDHKEISEKNLARIIQARVEEILDYVVWEIRRSGFERKLIAGIVLTGGGALLNHIEKLSEYHTGLPTRIGIPIEPLAHGYTEQLSSPIYATAIGLLMRGIEDREKGRFNEPAEIQEELVAPKENLSTPKVANEEEEEESRTAPGGRWIDSLFKKTKEWFEAEPDADL
jgi:cell division protein FtsA